MSVPLTETRLTEERWQRLWQALGGSAPDGSYRQLRVAYDEPQRFYHNGSHIEACLAHFDRWQHLALAPARVELALWTHDLVYDTRRQDNEAASAELTTSWLEQAGLQHHATKVGEMILATCHRQPPDDPDAALVVDLDLSILASAAEHYAAYEQAIRAEYAWVEESLFRTGRARLLQHLLAMPHLYQSPTLAQRWEAQARTNLQQALDRLRP
ncbi:MAG: hypothetical protein ABWY06_09010 [Pseudomonas sp.]|uniref:HD domain-containing protein n=1 Tax=Pseudomonas sp. TaxID=306 RepID=UPI0033958075